MAVQVESSQGAKSFKRAFAVPVVHSNGSLQDEPGEKDTADIMPGENTEESEKQNMKDSQEVHVEYKVSQTGAKIGKLQQNKDTEKKKVKKMKATGFKAPVSKADENADQISCNTTTAKEKPSVKKRKMPKNVGPQDDPLVKKKKIKKKDCTDEPDQLIKKAKVVKEKTHQPLKPVRSLSDEEYDKIFESALERVLQQSDGDVKVEFIMSSGGSAETGLVKDEIEETSHVTEKASDVIEELSEDKAFEELENIGHGAEGNLPEEAVPLNGDLIDGNDQHNHGEGERVDEIQLQNEITPAVSENEVSNITKPDIVPVKAKKPAARRKKLHPTQLSLGQEKSNKENINLNEKSSNTKPRKRKKKLTKQNEMMNRDFQELGTWVQCVKPTCLKWRHLKDISDPSVLPERWTCDMNSDELYNSCDKAEEDFDESIHAETFIYTHFVEGSVVWAKMVGYPWWPAMVEIDPDIGEYFDADELNPMLPTHYHVVFFDKKVSRAWVRTTYVKNFSDGHEEQIAGKSVLKGQSYKREIDAAKKNAEEALLTCSLKERLKKYSFSARFKGTWGLSSEEDKTEENLSQGLEYVPKRTKRRKRHTLGEHDMNVVDNECLHSITDGLELGLDGTTVDEILDNAESILSSAGELCSMDDSFVEPEDDPDFEPPVKEQGQKIIISGITKKGKRLEDGKITKQKKKKKNKSDDKLKETVGEVAQPSENIFTTEAGSSYTSSIKPVKSEEEPSKKKKRKSKDVTKDFDETAACKSKDHVKGGLVMSIKCEGKQVEDGHKQAEDGKTTEKKKKKKNKSDDKLKETVGEVTQPSENILTTEAVSSNTSSIKPEEEPLKKKKRKIKDVTKNFDETSACKSKDHVKGGLVMSIKREGNHVEDGDKKAEGTDLKCKVKKKNKKFKVVVATDQLESLVKTEKDIEVNETSKLSEDVNTMQEDSQVEESQSLLGVNVYAPRQSREEEQSTIKPKGSCSSPKIPKKKKKKHEMPCKTNYKDEVQPDSAITSKLKVESAKGEGDIEQSKEIPVANNDGVLDITDVCVRQSLKEESDEDSLNDQDIGIFTDKHCLVDSEKVNTGALPQDENSDPFDVDEDEVEFSFTSKDQISSKVEENSEPFEACEE